jgi:hypothetical protein
MKSRVFSQVLAGLITVALATAASAQNAVDCSKSRNPERCEARQKARVTCQDKRGAERRRCVADHMPAPDCARAQSPSHCKALQAAREACKDKTGVAHRQCLEERGSSKP